MAEGAGGSVLPARGHDDDYAHILLGASGSGLPARRTKVTSMLDAPIEPATVRRNEGPGADGRAYVPCAIETELYKEGAIRGTCSRKPSSARLASPMLLTSLRMTVTTYGPLPQPAT